MEEENIFQQEDVLELGDDVTRILSQSIFLKYGFPGMDVEVLDKSLVEIFISFFMVTLLKKQGQTDNTIDDIVENILKTLNLSYKDSLPKATVSDIGNA